MSYNFLLSLSSLLLFQIDAKNPSKGVEYSSIRKLFNDEHPAFSNEIGSPSVVDIIYGNHFDDYVIAVNNEPWLYSGKSAFRSDGKWSTTKLTKSETQLGFDAFGSFHEVILHYEDSANSDAVFLTHFKYYPERPDMLREYPAYCSRPKPFRTGYPD